MFILPELPYAYDALSPVISDRTMHHHHDKHHAKYVEVLNQLVKEQGIAADNLEDVVRKAAAEKKAKLFNNAAQAWNHAFFWLCMTPGAKPAAGDLAEAIKRDFGGPDALKEAFVNEGVGHFASGWVWLAAQGETLKVLSTHDGENLLTHEGLTPLLVCDLWEHAYYLDHQQDRKGFLEGWFDKLVDWSFAAKQYDAARGKAEPYRYPVPVAA